MKKTIEKTTVDFFGRAMNGYGTDVKSFMAKKLDLPIELFTASVCEYIETNYYAWWYYEVVGGGDDESTWFGIEPIIKNDLVNHAFSLIASHGDNVVEQLCEKYGYQI